MTIAVIVFLLVIGLIATERVDRTKTTAGDVDLPCVGVFEMENGRIKVWRDYFDMATYTNAMRA